MSMPSDRRQRRLNDCGCCEGVSLQTPAGIYNRPGLSAIAYRIGIHSEFKQSLIARLSASNQPALYNFTTRDDNDFSIALLDAWAAVSDVLTFYQGRIANECYLRTATETFSVRELSRLIGYELSSGVAAGVYLAFKIEEPPKVPMLKTVELSISQAFAQAVPRRVTIGIGAKVQSIPGQDEQAQVFETVEKIEARADWNELKPRMSRVRLPEIGDDTLYLKNISLNLNPGDALLLIGDERTKDPGNEKWDFRRIKAVSEVDAPDPSESYTIVTLEQGLGSNGIGPARENPKVYALRQRANLFGCNAPDWRTMSDTARHGFLLSGLQGEYYDNKDFTDHKVSRIDPQIDFEWGSGSPDSQIGTSDFSVRWTGWVKPVSTGTYTFYTRSDDGVRLRVNGVNIIDNWTNHSETEDIGRIYLESGQMYPIRMEYYEHGGLATIKLSWSGPDVTKEIIPRDQLHPYIGNEWPGFTMESGRLRNGLYAEYFDNMNFTNRKVTRIDSQVNYVWGNSSPDPSINANTFSARWTGWIKAGTSGTHTFHTVSDDGVRLRVNNILIINNWTTHPPTEDTGTVYLEEGSMYEIRLDYFESGGWAKIKLFWSGPGIYRQIIRQEHLYISDTYLDAVYPKILPESWLVLSSSGVLEVYRVEEAAEDSKTDFTLTSKTSRVTLTGKNLNTFNQRLRETTVFAQSELLETAETPIKEDIAIGSTALSLDRSVEGLSQGQKLIISGDTVQDGKKFGELVTLLRTEQDGDVTKLVFSEGLKKSYRRKTVTIYANVAGATHGETVQEVLGSGDAGRAFQRFTLRQPPLTRVSSDSPSGTESTLEVRVNDLLCQEVSTFYGRGPEERIYITRTDDSGRTTVIFGDGKTGARLPTGQENIKARYRKGIGISGLVKAQQLSQLMTRPLGVKEVSNPLASEGAADPESLSDARRNAPLTVLTLDRIVSLKDYEDFACAFAGIDKALATSVLINGRCSVILTAAGAKGAVVEKGSLLHKNLLAAMRKAGDKHVHVIIESYNPRSFCLSAKIRVKSNYQGEKVIKSVESLLRQSFSFRTRLFGQPVTLSEVMAVIQNVPGVHAVVVDALYPSDEDPDINNYLDASMPSLEGDTVNAAELLTLDTRPLPLEIIP